MPTWRHSVKPTRPPTARQVTEHRPLLPTGVALAGMPGARKSTRATALAVVLGVSVVDLDEQIDAREGVGVAEFFRRHGEVGFRGCAAAKRARLQGQPNRTPPVVAPGGGGGVAEWRSADLLRGRALAIYLWSTPAHLLEALQDESEQSRWPLSGQGDMKERFERFYRACHQGYLEFADLVLGLDPSWDDLCASALAEMWAWLGAMDAAAGEVG